uniref:Pancreatic trypsin inhibitor n=1 Tax=Rhipicephalus zambeziensis TaxID=60191 RepID=A0A224YAZ7_9ACAR
MKNLFRPAIASSILLLFVAMQNDGQSCVNAAPTQRPVRPPAGCHVPNCFGGIVNRLTRSTGRGRQSGQGRQFLERPSTLRLGPVAGTHSRSSPRPSPGRHAQIPRPERVSGTPSGSSSGSSSVSPLVPSSGSSPRSPLGSARGASLGSRRGSSIGSPPPSSPESSSGYSPGSVNGNLGRQPVRGPGRGNK